MTRDDHELREMHAEAVRLSELPYKKAGEFFVDNGDGTMTFKRDLPVPWLNENNRDIDAYVDFVESRWSSHPGVQPNNELRDLCIMGFGLGGECGGVQEKLKKYVRDDFLDLDKLRKELGDVLFYWTKICTRFGFLPSEVIAANKEKLNGREARGTLRGSGDDR